MAYNLRTNEILLHGKFQPPNFNGVAVHRSQPEGQTKRGLSNICLDSRSKCSVRHFSYRCGIHVQRYYAHGLGRP